MWKWRDEVRVGWTSLALLGVIGMGCSDDGPRPPPPERVVHGPAAPSPAEEAKHPQPEIRVRHSPLVQIVPTGGRVVDARVLVISADGTESSLSAIRQTLGYLGTPHDVLIATQAPPLAAEQLASGTHGRYNAILLTTGNLVFGSGGQSLSAFSDGEWQVLATYEATFKVRRAALYTSPDASYGFSSTTSVDTSATPLSTQCTVAARTVFPYLNCTTGVLIRGAFAYPAIASDAATVPLLIDNAGRVLAATRAYPDGREALVLNFAQAPSLIHTLQLFHGVVGWAARGVFIGERHAYVGVQIDDVFSASNIYTGGTYRLTDADLDAASQWQAAKRAQPLTGGMRYQLAFNGGGTTNTTDPLVLRARALVPAFPYINHTYNHRELNGATYVQTLDELRLNEAAANQLGLAPISGLNLVTPGITGIDNPEAMRAAFDFGVRYLVTDTSQPGQDNPSPNAGIFNPHQPGILMIPRRPTNLFYNVSTPSEWTAEYNDTYRSFWGRDLGFEEILDRESDVLVRYLLKGENDPWMFHQADLRAYAAGRSLLGDLLDRTFAKYTSYVEVPLLGPTMDELGARVADRVRYDGSGANATVNPDAASITVRVTNGATVPVTGACAPSNELYAGERISYVALPAGGSTTVPLAVGACPGAGGTGGTGGMGGAGGSGGTMFTLPCAALAVETGQIGPGQNAAALTTAQLTGTQDVWDDYVEVFPSSRITCRYDLPAGISPSALTALALRVNYRGPDLAHQAWSFELFEATTATWIALGNNAFAPAWIWTPATFNAPPPLGRFVSSGNIRIRYGTTSDVDASDIDQLVIMAATSGGAGGTTGTGGTTGMGGSGGGTIPFSLACANLTVASGQIGPGQTAAALTTAELTGTQDVWESYVELFPSSRIVCRYDLPATVAPARVTALSLQVNYRGPRIAFQVWSFEAFDSGTGTWVQIGDNGFAPSWVWTPATFAMPPPLDRFFSGSGLQVRFGTGSNFDAADIDQMIVTGLSAR